MHRHVKSLFLLGVYCSVTAVWCLDYISPVCLSATNAYTSRCLKFLLSVPNESSQLCQSYAQLALQRCFSIIIYHFPHAPVENQQSTEVCTVPLFLGNDLAWVAPQVAVKLRMTPVYLFFIRYSKSLESFSWLNLNQYIESLNQLNYCVISSQKIYFLCTTVVGIRLLI